MNTQPPPDLHEPITTPGDMVWVPCDHAITVKNKAGVCEACRGTGRVLITISRDAKVLP